MSTNYVDQSNSNKNLVIHHPLSNFIQIQTEEIETTVEYPRIISSLTNDSDVIPVVISYHHRMNSSLSSRNLFQIREYKLWSIFSTIFCCFIIGIFAIHMSCATRKTKRLGNLIKARDFSKLTVLLNIIAMTSGFIIIIVLSLRYTGNILP